MNPTDTNQASDLCKEVYEHTGWKPTDWQHGDEDGQPLYTSDYLLEKLPPTYYNGRYKDNRKNDDVKNIYWIQVERIGAGGWLASYKCGTDESKWFASIHLSPLKALLKLTIALSEAGELK